MGEVLSAHR
ncbi:hypothetical protein D030_4403A, partial [Vibrio parahaemolyticus AQ3810]